jgi:DNA-binding NarL/FixJ family response regulator
VEIGTVIRILLVDDHEPFRQVVSSMLRGQANLQVIAEAHDGLEAVRQAKVLQPDLILLDIGLPHLNGIRAARQIAQVAPSSKIIFLTQESSCEIVEEAFSLGAWGYVIKVNAGAELLAAVDAVSQGSQFVSSGLNEHGMRTLQ